MPTKTMVYIFNDMQFINDLLLHCKIIFDMNQQEFVNLNDINIGLNKNETQEQNDASVKKELNPTSENQRDRNSNEKTAVYSTSTDKTGIKSSTVILKTNNDFSQIETNSTEETFGPCHACSGTILPLTKKHWKALIIFLGAFSLILFVVLIVLLSILSKSSDEKDNPVAVCNFDLCLNNGTCSESDTDLSCKCTPGYSGKFCQHNPCSFLSCLHGGTCLASDEGDTASCVCNLGYNGTHCQVTPCTNVACYNGGECKITNGDYFCSCPIGTTGEFCEETPCTSSDFRCWNGGTCLFSLTTPTCTCPENYYGEACELFCQYDLSFYGCSFEDDDEGFCFLEQDVNDDLNWTKSTGSTPSLNTGPQSAYKGKYYMYLEASPPAQERHVARMISKKTLSTCGRCLKFAYHMYGAGVGTLNVYNGPNKIWTQSGDQRDQWHTVSIDINAFVNEHLIFEGVRGGVVTGDIAVDEIQLSPGACSP